MRYTWHWILSSHRVATDELFVKVKHVMMLQVKVQNARKMAIQYRLLNKNLIDQNHFITLNLPAMGSMRNERTCG